MPKTSWTFSGLTSALAEWETLDSPSWDLQRVVDRWLLDVLDDPYLESSAPLAAGAARLGQCPGTAVLMYYAPYPADYEIVVNAIRGGA